MCVCGGRRASFLITNSISLLITGLLIFPISSWVLCWVFLHVWYLSIHYYLKFFYQSFFLTLNNWLISWFFKLLLLFIYLFIYFWVCWVFVSVRGLSLVGASGGHSSSRYAGLSLSRPLVAEHRLQTRRLSDCGSRAQLLCGMWDLPRPGLEPVSPALAGRFSTTAPPGKPLLIFLNLSSPQFHFNLYFIR